MSIGAINTSVSQVLAASTNTGTTSLSRLAQGLASQSGGDPDGGPAAGNDHDADDISVSASASASPHRGRNVNTSA